MESTASRRGYTVQLMVFFVLTLCAWAIWVPQARYRLGLAATAEAAGRVREAIAELHSYELPECVVLPIEGGSEEYLEWIGENVAIG